MSSGRAPSKSATSGTIYPDNVIVGSHFTTGLAHPGGSAWAAVENRCTLLLGLIPTNDPAACNADTTYAAGIGTPPGSLQQGYQPPANGLAPLLFNATTVATLHSFSAARSAKGVLVRWRTGSETGTLGFNVYREARGKRVRVNSSLIPARGNGRYSFLDRRSAQGRNRRLLDPGGRARRRPLVARACDQPATELAAVTHCGVRRG